ncbi:DUF1707 SHOCT-like domain-containing protein [Thermomonospora catenispora]|uniref:DUF1707 SHOCT-like domain-containing protein n=1 Tax=Thermomonospora catenispora TaxID=2493090 RepID=UPI0011209FF3|nr:DUF1707 domain-containing protein [Thermomonospora catenispora]TNY38792.1 DUF1707 domain-containing protein [Thermomonospora catenispora]
MNSPDPRMRASDADRDRVAEALREHCAVGRITVEELQERLQAVYDAKTYGELEAVTADLPEEDLYQRPLPSPRTGSAEPARQGDGALAKAGERGVLAVWATVSAINFVIWLAVSVTAGMVYPWWIWMLVPLLLHALFRGGRRG